ncbi:MAG: S9 family peptidase, partial [Xanthomonadales bacterium]|nr:S9 family peptidase [Xanthomonadales bacterium]
MKLKHPLSTFAAIGTLLFAPLALANSITIENLARQAAIRSVSMSPEGDMIVAIVAAPGSDYQETALATWDLNDLEAGPVVTPSGDKMKFIGANALKSGMVNVTARQEWTGELGGCGEGSVIGNTATFVVKSYLTDKKHQEFEEAFAETGYRMGMSDRMRRCMEISGSAGLVSTLPLDPSKVLIRRTDRTDLRTDYFLYDLQTKKTELLFRGNDDTAPALFDRRNGEVLVRSDTESKNKDYEQTYYMRSSKDGDFELQPALTTMLSDRYTQNVVGINEATGEFYILTNRFSDKVQAYSYNPKTGEWSDPLVGSPDFNIASLIFDRRKDTFNQIIGYVVQGPEFDTTFVDPEMSAIHEGLKAAFKGQNVNISNYNDDLSRILFTTGNNKNTTAYHVLKDRTKVTT